MTPEQFNRLVQMIEGIVIASVRVNPVMADEYKSIAIERAREVLVDEPE